MKKILLIISVMFFTTAYGNGFSSHSLIKPYTDTTVLPQILSIPLSSYIGKSVDSLLSVLPNTYTSRGFIPVGIGYCKGVYQSYFSAEYNNCYIEIFIDTFQHLPIPNRTPSTTWDMTLAKLETISWIKVYKNNNVCLFGCNNANYE